MRALFAGLAALFLSFPLAALEPTDATTVDCAVQGDDTAAIQSALDLTDNVTLVSCPCETSDTLWIGHSSTSLTGGGSQCLIEPSGEYDVVRTLPQLHDVRIERLRIEAPAPWPTSGSGVFVDRSSAHLDKLSIVGTYRGVVFHGVGRPGAWLVDSTIDYSPNSTPADTVPGSTGLLIERHVYPDGSSEKASHIYLRGNFLAGAYGYESLIRVTSVDLILASDNHFFGAGFAVLELAAEYPVIDVNFADNVFETPPLTPYGVYIAPVTGPSGRYKDLVFHGREIQGGAEAAMEVMSNELDGMRIGNLTVAKAQKHGMVFRAGKNIGLSNVHFRNIGLSGNPNYAYLRTRNAGPTNLTVDGFTATNPDGPVLNDGFLLGSGDVILLSDGIIADAVTPIRSGASNVHISNVVDGTGIPMQ